MMAGLQGSGKTTAVGQARPPAARARAAGRCSSPPTSSARPRSSSCGCSASASTCRSYSETRPTRSPVARGAHRGGGPARHDVVIVDTAGRLQVDAELMDELRQVRDVVQPNDTLLVVDAMTGQEAVNVATAFDEAVGLDGVVLTKIDGDARGGAALSVKEVVGKPILFVGTGEKLEDFEPFHPDRMASRILGMGDVLTLIEKAEADLRRGGVGRRPRRSSARASSRSRTSSTRCARSARWARCRTSEDAPGDAQGAARTPRSTRASSAGSRRSSAR